MKVRPFNEAMAKAGCEVITQDMECRGFYVGRNPAETTFNMLFRLRGLYGNEYTVEYDSAGMYEHATPCQQHMCKLSMIVEE